MFLMGKDIYHSIVEMVLKEVLDRKFHKFREDQDRVRKIVFYNSSEGILRHMCACADRMVAIESDYSGLKGVIFSKALQKEYSRRAGDYTVNVGFMVPRAKQEQKSASCQEAA